LRRLDVVPRASAKLPLFSVWTCARAARGPLDHDAVIMRDERGERTEASESMRRFFGLTGASARSARSASLG
jgi:hypothetical protein